jgi:hypothetical protein
MTVSSYILRQIKAILQDSTFIKMTKAETNNIDIIYSMGK